MPAQTYACVPPLSNTPKSSSSSQVHITSTVFLPSKVLSCAHTQQAGLLLHPLKWKTSLFRPYDSHCRLPWKHPGFPATLVYLLDSQTNSRHHLPIPQTSRKAWQDEGRSGIKLWYRLHVVCICVCVCVSACVCVCVFWVQGKQVCVPWCWSPRHSGWFGRAVGNEACSAGCTVGRISPEWTEAAQWRSAGLHRRSTLLNFTLKV